MNKHKLWDTCRTFPQTNHFWIPFIKTSTANWKYRILWDYDMKYCNNIKQNTYLLRVKKSIKTVFFTMVPRNSACYLSTISCSETQ